MTTADRLTALLALSLAIGCSAAEDETDSAQEVEGAADFAALEESATPEQASELAAIDKANTITISCPRDTRATWIQALNGTVDLIVGQTGSFGFPIGGPTTTLRCLYGPSTTPQILDHSVQFEPGTVPSACGAKTTFSGTGQQIGGGVPPFGGWQFRSKRVTATATYNESTGVCRFQLPVVGPESMLERRVTQACTPIQNGYSCPADVAPL